MSEQESIPTPVKPAEAATEPVVEPTQDAVENKDEIVMAKQNVVITRAIFEALPPDGKKPIVVLTIPAAREDVIDQVISTWPAEQIQSYHDGRMFVDSLREGYRHSLPAETYASTLEDPESEWTQGVSADVGVLQAGRPRYSTDNSPVLTGERAVNRILGAIGGTGGGLIQIPLWHSGFWVTLRTPSDDQWLALEYEMTASKIALGRSTGGAAFSNNAVYANKAIMNLFSECVYDTTLVEKDPSYIARVIDVNDIPHIAWGLAVAQYPRGFHYARAVLEKDPTKKRVIKELINIARCQFVNRRALTAAQIAHMCRRMGSSMDKESVTKYRDGFTRNKGRRVQLNDSVAIRLRSPMLEDYVTAGEAWVNSVVQLIDKTVGYGKEIEAEKRNLMIEDSARATYLRQFTHYIEAFEILNPNNGEVESEVLDRETIEITCNGLSRDEEITDKIISECQKYINDTTIAIIAVPTENEFEENRLADFPHLLPLDVITTFFTLGRHRSSKIRDRM